MNLVALRRALETRKSLFAVLLIANSSSLKSIFCFDHFRCASLQFLATKLNKGKFATFFIVFQTTKQAKVKLLFPKNCYNPREIDLLERQSKTETGGRQTERGKNREGANEEKRNCITLCALFSLELFAARKLLILTPFGRVRIVLGGCRRRFISI